LRQPEAIDDPLGELAPKGARELRTRYSSFDPCAAVLDRFGLHRGIRGHLLKRIRDPQHGNC
jgi:hypothetical protein